MTNVLDVAKKELIDIARDRRAVFVMLVLPVFLYPLLMIGIALASSAQIRSLKARKYSVWVEGECPEGLWRELNEPDLNLEPLKVDPRTDHLRALERGEVGAILRIPPGVEKQVAAARDEAKVQIYWHGGLDGSSFARRKLETAVENWRDRILHERLVEHDLTPAFLTPVRSDARDLGPKGAALGRMLAMLLVVMCVSGAFYPATDLGAGEKERGTLETLLVSPASRVDLALGKLAAIFAVALAAALANLASLGITFAHLDSLMPTSGSNQALQNVTVDLRTILSILAVLTPLALLFSAVALLVSTHAASYKEAQSYLTPVLLVAILPALAAGLPGIELTLFNALMPILGPAVLIKELLAGTASGTHLILVAMSSALYAFLAAGLVARVYDREDVLFRPAAQPPPSLLTKEVKGSTPNSSQATVAALTALLLVWFIGTRVQAKHPLPGLVITLVLCIAAPTLFYAKALGLDLRATFNLRRASKLAYLAAFLLAAGGVVFAMDIARLQIRMIGPPTKEELEAYARLARDIEAEGTFVALAIIAATPAVCEELLFRGFVLSGYRRTMTPLAAAFASAVLFALVHLDPARLAHTSLLGIVLGFLAIRSGSIVPCSFFHFLYNGTNLLVQMHSAKFAALGLLEADAPTMKARAFAVISIAAGAFLMTRLRPVDETPPP